MSHTQPQRCATIDLATGEVARFAAELVSTKRVLAGQAVSYGGEYVTDRETTLALVAAGYAEGVPRSAMSAAVSIGGRECRIAGRVAMDQLVIDLGPDGAEQPGAEVVFWGEGGRGLEQWAADAGVPASMAASYVGPRTAVELRMTVASSDDMEHLGGRIGSILGAGDAVILTGELGAGKTTMTRGLAAALGAEGRVQSPTFVIARTHPTRTVPLLHVDAYRLGEEALLDDLDLDLEGSITVAEWGGPLTHALEHWFDVRIDRASGTDADPLDTEADNPRVVSIRAGGSLAQQRLLDLVQAEPPAPDPQQEAL